MMEEFPQQLYDAIGNLEFTFIECHKLVKLSTIIDTAAWAYDPESREEEILFNPQFLKNLSPVECEIILRHEIQHKAIFKELGSLDLDHSLLNVALDIAISRVFSRAFDHATYKQFCDKMYGADPDNLASILAVAWYGLEPGRIVNDEIRDYYGEFWRMKKDPSPLEVYYRLLEISGYQDMLPFGGGRQERNRRGTAQDGKASASEEERSGKTPQKEREDEGHGFPENERERHAESQTGDEQTGDGRSGGKENERGVIVREIPAEALEDLSKDSIGEKILKAPSRGGVLERWQKEIEIEKERFDAFEIEEFMKRIQSVDVLDRTAHRIRDSLFKETRRQVYPLQPSRLGYVYILTGISQMLHQYYNRVSLNRIPRLNIYVDVSPSMHPYREEEVFLIDRLKDLFPTTFFVFGAGVKEFNVADFAGGKYPVAHSTDFNPVVDHLMASVVECGVVFTDGGSYITPENRLKFPRSGKRLFTIYFNNYGACRRDGPNRIRSDLDEISEEVMQIDLFDAQEKLTHRVVL